MPRKFIISAALILAVLGMAGLAAWVLIRSAQKPGLTADPTPPPLVETVMLALASMDQEFVGYGNARPKRAATLSAEVADEVIELVGDLREGTAVGADQVLVRIDDRRYRQLLLKAQAQAAVVQAQIDELDVRRANLDALRSLTRIEVEITATEERRLIDLFEDEEANKHELDEARLAHRRVLRGLQELDNELALLEPTTQRLQASLRVEQAVAELAAISVEDCSIKAPFDGVIETLHVETGDKVQVGSLIVRVVDPSVVEVPIRLPASTRPHVGPGSACRISVDTADGSQWNGVVARISPVVDQESRTFFAYVEVDNTTQETPLAPGTFVRATVGGPRLVNVLSIPRDAIVDGGVFRYQEGIARRVAVVVAHRIHDTAVIEGDLQPGQLVITTNLDRLADGSPVRIESDAPALSMDSDSHLGEAASP